MDDPKLLMAAIIANPAEDTPRLAFADWLDEHGDPDRARFIRLQFEIEKLPPIGAKASKAKKEEEKLLKKHRKKWAGGIAGLVEEFRFRRGFVEHVRVTVGDFLKHGERLFELAPIREVLFDKLGDRMPALVKSPLLGRAETLGFSPYIMDQLADDGRFERLLGARQLATVRGLNLSMNSLDDDHMARLARCPRLGAVTHLDLSWNQITDAGLRAVANSRRLPALSSLDVSGNGQVDEAGMRAIVDSPLAGRLERLCVCYQAFGDAPVELLARAKRLKRLRTLDLSGNALTDAGAKALAAAPQLEGLQQLVLRGHRTTLGQKGRELLSKRFGKDACVF